LGVFDWARAGAVNEVLKRKAKNNRHGSKDGLRKFRESQSRDAIEIGRKEIIVRFHSSESAGARFAERYENDGARSDEMT
jgi:hypothetical protein